MWGKSDVDVKISILKEKKVYYKKKVPKRHDIDHCFMVKYTHSWTLTQIVWHAVGSFTSGTRPRNDKTILILLIACLIHMGRYAPCINKRNFEYVPIVWKSTSWIRTITFKQIFNQIRFSGACEQ